MLDGIKFQSTTGDRGQNAISFLGEASNLTLRNCVFVGPTGLTDLTRWIWGEGQYFGGQLTIENCEITGFEAVLGGKLAEKAVWVDEAKCIGCQYCVHVASNTFLVDEFHGRSRALRQDGDSVDVIQEAIDTCPVDCIHWVKFEELNDLENSLDRDMFQSFGKPPRMNKH